ncbi:hypothetical protein FA95DRAFT_887611 [Auriscalpium vulgare]|uniref:Uncharacterized protein n=1 Tax=Auriscalpium vulgare TaxID=40419 RepID=A0ACB8R8V3_9AGAM|nr:hypothetical protein FA95DRAFT_887611 [Auriscalpium vulgare]
MKPPQVVTRVSGVSLVCRQDSRVSHPLCGSITACLPAAPQAPPGEPRSRRQSPKPLPLSQGRVGAFPLRWIDAAVSTRTNPAQHTRAQRIRRCCQRRASGQRLYIHSVPFGLSIQLNSSVTRSSSPGHIRRRVGAAGPRTRARLSMCRCWRGRFALVSSRRGREEMKLAFQLYVVCWDGVL